MYVQCLKSYSKIWIYLLPVLLKNSYLDWIINEPGKKPLTNSHHQPRNWSESKEKHPVPKKAAVNPTFVNPEDI